MPGSIEEHSAVQSKRLPTPEENRNPSSTAIETNEYTFLKALEKGIKKVQEIYPEYTVTIFRHTSTHYTIIFTYSNTIILTDEIKEEQKKIIEKEVGTMTSQYSFYILYDDYIPLSQTVET